MYDAPTDAGALVTRTWALDWAVAAGGLAAAFPPGAAVVAAAVSGFGVAVVDASPAFLPSHPSPASAMAPATHNPALLRIRA